MVPLLIFLRQVVTDERDSAHVDGKFRLTSHCSVQFGSVFRFSFASALTYTQGIPDWSDLQQQYSSKTFLQNCFKIGLFGS